jgi:DNA-binding transcriptional ArsR family regulator
LIGCAAECGRVHPPNGALVSRSLSTYQHPAQYIHCSIGDACPLIALQRPSSPAASNFVVAAGIGTISQHLDVLEEAGLVRTRRDGRYKFHFIDTSPLRAIVDRWPPQDL